MSSPSLVRTLAVCMGLLPAFALLSGCSPTGTRAGIGMPRAFIYSNYETPFTAKRTRGEPLVIPDGLVMGKATTHQISLSPPSAPGFSYTDDFLTDRAMGAASAGWGNMGLEKAMADGNITEVIYGDAHKLNILSIYKRVTLKVYGPPAENGED